MMHADAAGLPQTMIYSGVHEILCGDAIDSAKRAREAEAEAKAKAKTSYALSHTVSELALVTGGSRGLGAATTVALAE
ncbi:hypothetical protein [Cupriavidus pampae]|uniref:Short-chain dehydrogenase n=1 Tax=Cupriavidus pampae TaxID=659251 RepID=A0ABM8XI31_9BURK|nr:hypothetical protein [Cupriavidus pampae]CAG9179806.1 hypothetical protein LMG32289_04416 [Cupriavidus pampae]